MQFSELKLSEDILSDPDNVEKAIGGLLDMIWTNETKKNDSVLFWYTRSYIKRYVD